MTFSSLWPINSFIIYISTPLRWCQVAKDLLKLWGVISFLIYANFLDVSINRSRDLSDNLTPNFFKLPPWKTYFSFPLLGYVLINSINSVWNLLSYVLMKNYLSFLFFVPLNQPEGSCFSIWSIWSLHSSLALAPVLMRN